jgi:protein O-GlcNAc transferase
MEYRRIPGLDTRPMFDTDRFRRHIEAAYLRMWDIFKPGDTPRSFTVSSD